MKDARQALLWRLGRLIDPDGPDLPTGNERPNDYNTTLDHLSQDRRQTVDEVLKLFQQIHDQCDCLAQEVLDGYEKLNIAFDAAAGIFKCSNTNDALQILNHIIGAATGSRFSYYLGRLTDQSYVPGNGVALSTDVIAFAAKDDAAKQAATFFAHNEQALRHLAGSDLSIQVQKIDRATPEDHDSDGRGNVLALDLSAPGQDIDSLGTLVFVRTNDQELFSAVQAKLAQSLARMGSTVLSNILYADRLRQSYLQTIASLVRAMEAKDTYTSGHSTRVAEMACALGKQIQLSKFEIQLLEWAGLMHDIGKIGIRDEVLDKPGKLTDAEFRHIKTHPAKSYQVLEPLEGFQLALAAVRSHHEHYDGSGYPDGLVGPEIPLLARVIQVADVWDALTSTRPYRQAMSPEKALDVMRQEAGITMDPHLVAEFEKVLAQSKELAPTGAGAT